MSTHFICNGHARRETGVAQSVSARHSVLEVSFNRHLFRLSSDPCSCSFEYPENGALTEEGKGGVKGPQVNQFYTRKIKNFAFKKHEVFDNGDVNYT